MTRNAGERLHRAASEGSVSAASEALQTGANVNTRAEFGDTALNVAAQNGHIEVVKLLLENGADIENKGGAGMTPLMNAAVSGHVGVVRALLAGGAKVGDDVLRSVQLKVGILEENAESGMVRPDAVEAWRRFLDMLIEARQREP